jgi:hypothetical protein
MRLSLAAGIGCGNVYPLFPAACSAVAAMLNVASTELTCFRAVRGADVAAGCQAPRVGDQ